MNLSLTGIGPGPGFRDFPAHNSEQTSSPQIEDAAFNSNLGPEYQPQTEAGRLAMAGTTGAMSAAAFPAGGATGSGHFGRRC